MAYLSESPFKIDQIEDNAKAFGLRIQELEICINHIFNRQNILLYGSRGIGKSSFGFQLQKILTGDTTLLERCKIESKFPEHICVRTSCREVTQLSQLVYNLLFDLKEKIECNEQFVKNGKKISFGIDLKILKASYESSSSVKSYSPANMVTEFSSELKNVLKYIKENSTYKRINILIDEVDEISKDINFAHFFRAVDEELQWARMNDIFFIFIAQTGIYSRLLSEDKSFCERVSSVELPIMYSGDLEYILDYASKNAKKPFSIDQDAKNLIISLSSGYPNVPHLLGNSAFFLMENEKYMTYTDVIHGIEYTIRSNKKNVYLSLLDTLNENEKKVIINMTNFEGKAKIPLEISLDWITEKYINWFIEDNLIDIGKILSELEEKGFIRLYKNRQYCIFSQELFRIFLTLARLEMEKDFLLDRKKDIDPQIQNLASTEALTNMQLGEFDKKLDLSNDEKKETIKEISNTIKKSETTFKWEKDDFLY